MNDFQRMVVDGERTRPIRPAVFDIETSGLEGSFDIMFCTCFIEPSGKISTYRIDDARNPDKSSDRWLVREVVKKMSEYDLLVGWYSSGFDFRFLNTRALIHGLRVPERKYRRDLCMVSRGNLQLRNNKLATVNEAVFGNNHKTFITPKVRLAALRGDKWAIDYYVHHCREDVRDTLRTYKKFMPLLSKKLRNGG